MLLLIRYFAMFKKESVVWKMEKTKQTYKPKIEIINMKQLVNSIRLNADSSGGPTCNLSFTEENACGVWSDGNDGPGGGGWSQMCMQIGPLLGCNKFGILSCSTIFSPIAK